MRFTNTLAAARGIEEKTWAVADGLVQDFKEADVTPTPLHFKEAAEKLAAAGFDYNPKTLTDYWRVGATFGSKRRRASATVGLYKGIVNGLWGVLDSETRSNDLVRYAVEFLRSEPKPSARKAEAWAREKRAALNTERREREEAELKEELEEQLALDEAELAKAIKADDMKAARAILGDVNETRRRLGMELLKLDEEEAAVETDEKATEEAEQETAEEEAARFRNDARTEIEYAIARVGSSIAFLGNTFRRVQGDLIEEDLDAYAEEIELEEGRLALVRSGVSGSITDAALAKAVAQWESESANH